MILSTFARRPDASLSPLPHRPLRAPREPPGIARVMMNAGFPETLIEAQRNMQWMFYDLEVRP